MTGVFISSTGTEIGKTLVTAALCHQLKALGKPVEAIKPVISGVSVGAMEGTDTAIIADGLGRPLDMETIERISPFRFRAPLAPVMAAKLEGRELDYDAVIESCKATLQANPFTIVEGVGGSFVPMTNTKLVTDWIADLGLPTLLVTGGYLGTISHTIATVRSMEALNLKIKAIVVSESAPLEDDTHPDLQETADQIAHWCSLPTTIIPRLQGARPWRSAPDLTQLL